MSRSDAEPQGMTYAEYAALPDDGRRYQLVEGELVVTPSPTLEHQDITGEIFYRMRLHVDATSIGRVFVAPLDVVLADRTALQPDVLFVSNGRREILERGNVVFGPPDLCVEVLSPGTARLDRVRKLDLYARFGVPHCWLVDPATRQIEEYALCCDAYRVACVVGFDEEFRPAVPEGFVLTLAGFGGRA